MRKPEHTLKPERVLRLSVLLFLLRRGMAVCYDSAIREKEEAPIMNLLQLRYFRQLARDENFTKAAQTLYISQPALSQMVSRLEEELGLQLFQREGKKVRLNKNGEIFLEYINRCLDELDSGVDAMKKIRARDSREISFTSMGNISGLYYIMLDFKKRYPDVKLKYNACSAEESIRQLLDYRIEFAINNRPSGDRHLEDMMVQTSTVFACLGCGHPLSGQKLISIQDLRDSQFICNDFTTDRYETQRICNEAGFEPIISLECNDHELTYEILNREPYVMLLKSPALTIHDKDRQRRNDTMALFRENIQSHFYITRRKKHHFTPWEEELLQYIHSAFRQDLIRNDQALRSNIDP